MFCRQCEANPPASSVNASDFASTGCTSFKRESVTIHGSSKRHIFVRDSVIGRKMSGATVAANFQRQLMNQDEKTMSDMAVKFRTAYYIGKRELPLTTFKSLLELQKLNGVEMNKNYASDMKCAEMIATINEELKSELETNLREIMYFSILIGTDCSAKENEAMNVRYVSQSDGSVSTKLLGVVELEHAHADGKKNMILK